MSKETVKPPPIQPPVHPLLVAQGLHKSFAKRGSVPIEVLHGIDFTLKPGERVAIVGKSGAGKSTLLHVLGTLEKPSEGSVRFLGQDVFAYNEENLSKFRNQQLGFVFQFHYLMLEFTALENVMMPALIAAQPKREARERANQLLSKVGLSSRTDHKPSQMSGGEQQRVAIARALMMSPKLLLTDEMTGNLDPVTGAQVFELVQSIIEEMKMAVVSVTHDETMAKTYDRVYRLTQGGLKIA